MMSLYQRKVFLNNLCRCFCTNASLTLVQQADGVKRITLNNPKKRNALSLTMLKQLYKDVFDNSDNPDLRCIIIDHNGPVFSSGHDLKELSSSDRSKNLEIFKTCSDLMIGLRQISVPVIAIVHGVAAAAGCQLVASCDISIASEKSLFSTPGASVGLFCSTPGIALSRSVPLKASAYMLFTGANITAQDALMWGLISKMAKEEELENVVDKVIQQILSKNRSVLALGKKFFYQQKDQDIVEAYNCGSCVMVDNLEKVEAAEGIQAFFEKRPPKW